MYCMTIEYLKNDDGHFDMEYYCNKHIPLCAQLFADYSYLGTVLRSEPGKKVGSSDIAWTSLDILFASKEGLLEGLSKVGKQITEDISNYTNIRPRMSFSEVDINPRDMFFSNKRKT